MKIWAILAVAGWAIAAAGCETPGKLRADQRIAILEPADGAIVQSPFKVRFAVTGMAVKPAGDSGVDIGHHHLLINRSSIGPGKRIEHDDAHLHFGKGQTEDMVSLAPGNYRLTAQFADGFHKSYGPQMSQTISITVK